MKTGRIFWKLFAAIYAATILALIGTAAYFSVSDQSIEQSFKSTRASVIVKTAHDMIAKQGVAAVFPTVEDWNNTPQFPRITILDTQGKSLTSPLFSTAGAQTSVTAPNGDKFMIASDTRVMSDKDTVRPTLAAPLLSGAFFGLMVSAFLALYFTRPLRHLSWALKEVSLGKFETRVGKLMGSRKDEITDLAKDVDIMAARLQQLVESKQRLLHDISHELRSPLARVQVAIGLLRQNPAKTDQMLDRIEQETERLNDLVEQILTLARLTSDADLSVNETVDVIELLTAIADDAAFEANSTNRQVNLMAKGSFISRVNGEVLCRAFENVIRNAVKYTKPDTSVDITADVVQDGKELHIVVEDHGPGMPEAMLVKMFEPFWRNETDQTSVGFGLGLAIARRAIELHKGRISVECAPQTGLHFKITLPQHQ
jgi:signal transduction histidine kinase